MSKIEMGGGHPRTPAGRRAALAVVAACAGGAMLAGGITAVTAASPQASSIRMAVAGPVTDRSGKVWEKERGFLGGRIATTRAGITATSADRLFQTERYDVDGYTIRVPAKGRYRVTLRLAETYFAAPGKRVFDVHAEGYPQVKGLDIFARAGAKNRAISVPFGVTVTDGTLDLRFVDRVNFAKVNAIKVDKVADVSSTATPTSTPSPRPTPTVTPTPTATPTVTPTSPRPRGAALIGMSTRVPDWDKKLAATGGVDARRLFGRLESPQGVLRLARSEAAAGRYAILSFKVPGNDWAGVAAGKYDTQLRGLAGSLAAIPGRTFVTLHHEPEKNGTPQAWAAMQRHALPILGAPANVDAGVIANGFWWSAGAHGYTDAEIARWLPADVLKVTEIVAADTYQGGTYDKPLEDAGVKIRRMSAWATRVGVTRLGIGEFNGLNAASITAAGDAILADRRFVFASLFNSSANTREDVGTWELSGERLEAFQELVARSRSLR